MTHFDVFNADANEACVRQPFANALTNRHADVAHAALTPLRRGGYTVSVRAMDRAFPGAAGR